jgi:hypothetical protein
MFTRGWSAFLEGNYYDFGDHDRTIFDPVVCVAGCAFNTKTTAASVLVGVNWRWGAKRLDIKTNVFGPSQLADDGFKRRSG